MWFIIMYHTIAKSFENDSTCEFLIMEDENGKMVAAGNKRKFDDHGTVVWLESIRVSSEYKGRGIATLLMNELISRSKESGANEILSCTIGDNHAMKKVFNKVSMDHINSIYMLDFGFMRSLKGWSAVSDSDSDPEHIVKALDVEKHIRNDARRVSWSPVKSERELEEILYSIKEQGGIGHLPGLFKLLWSSSDLKDSLSKGLIMKKILTTPHCVPAVTALVKDNSIQSLRSKYVCSIAATDPADVESALWNLCNDQNIINEIPAFVIALDGSILSKNSEFLDALPLQKENPGVIYSYSP